MSPAHVDRRAPDFDLNGDTVSTMQSDIITILPSSSPSFVAQEYEEYTEFSQNEDEEDAGEGEDEEEGKDVHSDIDKDLRLEDVSSPSKVKSRKRRRKRSMTINLITCKYECVRRVTKKFGFKSVDDGDDWYLYWTDYSVTLERVMSMKSYQKINHFPGMSEICRKDLLARNMNRLWKQFPKDYSIFPRTWCLPADYGDYQAFCRTKRNKTFILKPDSGSQGKGIFLTKSPKDIKPGEDLICQQYISKPFLIDGFKFDLRVYVLVTSCDPLRIFVFKDGLGRFSTVRYVEPNGSNLENIYMHLTNYSIQKNSDEFIRDEESGSKRRLSVINNWFRNNGYDVDKIWATIDDSIIKTLVSAHPTIKHNYRTCFPHHVKASACFEILGFDILLDHKLKPWVLEVNHSPSFTTNSKLDKEIKDSLVHDTLVLVNFSLCDKKKYTEEEKKRLHGRLMQKSKELKDDGKRQEFLNNLTKFEDSHIGNFRRIYPEDNEEKYERYFTNSCSLFQETAASKARGECSRLQREEIQMKNQHIDRMRKLNSAGYTTTSSSSCDVTQENGDKPSRSKRQVFSRLYNKNVPCNQSLCYSNIDSFISLPIIEKEEYERIGSMMQRDTLLRMLGIPELVKELLKYQRNSCKPVDDSVKPGERYCSNRPKMSVSLKSTNIPGQQTINKINQQMHSINCIVSGLSSNSKSHWNSSRNIQNHKESYSSDLRLNAKNKLSKNNINFSDQAKQSAFTHDKKGRLLDQNKNEDVQMAALFEMFGKHCNVDRKISVKSYDHKSSSRVITSPSSNDFRSAKRIFRKPTYGCDSSDLSVVSSPVPISIRIESQLEDHLRDREYSSLSRLDNLNTPTNRSTKAQRIRGASNSIRLKQLELLETRSSSTYI